MTVRLHTPVDVGRDQARIAEHTVYCWFTMLSDVELREIRVFLVLAEELHFGRTSVRLGISTSYVSQSIRLLEARVGGRLFDRTSRRVGLTPLGEVLRVGAQPAYQQLMRALEETHEAAVGVAGTLRVGMYTESLGGPHFLEIVRVYEQRHENVGVSVVVTGLARNYLNVLRGGEVDMLATRLPVTDPDIVVGPFLSRESRVLLVARTDQLAQREAVSLEDFADHPVSDNPAFPRDMMDALIPPVTPSGRVYRRVTSRNLEEMLISIAAGKQVHPTVPSFLDHHAHPGVAAIPISDLPPSLTALVWLKAARFPRVEAFARAAEDVLGSVQGST
jgi:DNA-binding transcriptional LysR family regulator